MSAYGLNRGPKSTLHSLVVSLFAISGARLRELAPRMRKATNGETARMLRMHFDGSNVERHVASLRILGRLNRAQAVLSAVV